MCKLKDKGEDGAKVVLPFRKFLSPNVWMCFQFKGHAVSAIFLNLKKHFEEHVKSYF